MAVEFIDDVAPASGGFEWLDAPGASGFDFIEGKTSPVSAGELNQRFADPSYNPTRAEFDIWQKAQDERGVTARAGDFLSKAGDAFSGVWDMVARGAKGVGSMVTDPERNDPLVTGTEAVARGVRNSASLVKGIADKVVKPDTFIRQEAQRFLNQKVYEFQGGDVLDPATARKPGMEQRKEWQAEFERDVLPDLKYRKFVYDRWQKTGIQPPDPNVSVITGRPAPFNADAADALSIVTDPMVFVPFGKALTPAKTMIRRAVASTLERGGRALEVAGQGVSKVAAIPERAAGKGFEWLSGSADAGTAAENIVKRGSVPAAAAGLAGFGVPGLTETAAAVAGGKVAGRTLQGAGQVAQAVGRGASAGPSRYGLFDRISKDAAAPEWLRRAANTSKLLDPAVTLAGAAAKGATEGAAIGTGLGALADGEDGAAAGLGAGIAFGSGGALAGRILGAGRYNKGLQERDLAAWLGSKSADEVANIANLKLSREQALNLADMERLAKGASGDVQFRYVTDKDFSQRFGVGKGAQVVNGDRPVVFVNTGYKGGRSMFHETLHALDALEGFAPQRQQLNRVLFDQTLPDGQVVSKGIYSAADLGEFTSQYRSRLNEAARSEFDLLTPEERTARIMSEVRSESFANLENGYSGGASVLASRGIKRRVADALLLSEADSMLGKMRSALESVGVKFEASGDPSELFVRNGKPITNTPAVDAALRDYVRAKDNITRKLVAGEDGEAGLIVRPEDIVKNPTLAETFKDSDLFAKNPDGSIKVTVQPSEVARIESQEQVAIKAARDAEAIAETARQTAEAAQAAIVEAETRATAAEQLAMQSQNREAVAQAKADKVKWREARRRGQEQLKLARAQEKAAREQAAAAKAKSVQLNNAKLSAGVPVLLSEREINLVQSRRVDAMIDALTKVPNLGEADSVKLKPNGAWEGRTFSEKQLAAFDALPDDVLSPSMKAKLRELNTLAQQDGQQIILDYNAALKNRKYSSGIAPSTRAVVPLTFNISKAGNFFMTTLDTTHFFRKLGQWRKTKPRAFDAWNGDTDAFLRDAFTYLDNHVNGRSGSVNLDSDAAAAVHKKNVINDFFNVPKGAGNEDANPVQISTRGDKDNLIRSRRFDRINRITPGAGDKFPIRYELQKANYLPDGEQAVPSRFQLRKPIVGPTGAKIIGYEWRSKMGEKWSERLGEMVSARVSDWENSDTSTGTGRDIVHLFHVQHPDGSVRLEGIRSAQNVLGINETRLMKVAKTEQAAQKYLADQMRMDVESAATRAMATPAEAARDFRVRNRVIGESEAADYARFARTILFEKDGKFLRRMPGALEGMQVHGWKVVANDPAKPPQSGANFLPAGVSPVSVQKQLRSQVEFDLAQKSPGPANLNQWLASAYLDVLDKVASRHGPMPTRTAQLQRIKTIADSTSEQEMATAFAALLTGGQNGAKTHLEQLAAMKALGK